MEETMPDVIEELKRAEIRTEAQRRELKFVQNEIINLKAETSTARQKIHELKTSHDTLTDILLNCEFESTHLKRKERLLDTTLSEAKKKSIVEQASLDDVHVNIWQKRQSFCDQAREFNNTYGLVALSLSDNSSEIRCEAKLVPKSQDDKELNELVLEIDRLKAEYDELALGEPTWDSHIEEATKEIERLTNEPFIAEEFVRLQNALNYCQKQTEIIETQCETVQQEIKSRDTLLSTAKPAKEKTQLQNNDYKHYSLKRDANKTRPYVPHSLPSPKKVTLPYRQRLLSYDKPELPVVKDNSCFKDINIPSEMMTSVDEDLGKHRQLNVDEDWQCRIMNSPPPAIVAPGNADEANQGASSAKKRFIPKTPSAISMKLLSSKKSSLSLEQQLYSIIGRKPNAVNAQSASKSVAVKSRESKTTSAAPVQPSSGMPLKGILVKKTLTIEQSLHGQSSVVCAGSSISVEVLRKTSLAQPSTRVPYLS